MPQAPGAARPSRRLRLWIAVVCLALPASALAWTERASFGVRVHGHGFHRAVLDSAKCGLEYKLYFSAPAERYPSAGGYYRFKARVKLQGGRSFVSPIFGNSGAGERVYVARHDTAPEACWAEQAQKLLAVDVQACRGRSCVPEPFE